MPRPSWNHSSVHNQIYAHGTQMFRAHLKAHTRILAFSLTKGIPTHERIAVRNICMRYSSRLGEICSYKRLLTNTSSTSRPFTEIEITDSRLAYITFIKGQ